MAVSSEAPTDTPSADGMSVNPAEQYRSCCKQLGAHVNSRLARHLPSSASEVSQLERLDFSSNLLGRRGIRPILQTILVLCNNVTSLNLSDNGLSNENVEELYHLLAAPPPDQCCPKLQHLDLSKNPISSRAGKLLCRLVDERQTLRTVCVEGTLMNAALPKLIAAKCAKKSPRFEGLAMLTAIVGEARVSGGQPTPSSIQNARPQSHLRTADTVVTDQPNVPATSVSGPVVSSAKRTSTKSAAGKPLSASSSGGAEAAAGEEWSAMETIWNLAAVAAPPEDGWTGLAAVMALVRQDVTIASMY